MRNVSFQSQASGGGGVEGNGREMGGWGGGRRENAVMNSRRGEAGGVRTSNEDSRDNVSPVRSQGPERKQPVNLPQKSFFSSLQSRLLFLVLVQTFRREGEVGGGRPRF